MNHIYDMGEKSLEDCLFVDVNGALNGDRAGFNNYRLREGHVYLLRQWHWQHWVLFKVDGITLAPINGK